MQKIKMFEKILDIANALQPMQFAINTAVVLNAKTSVMTTFTVSAQ
jgi:hypothetical protein